MDAAAGEPHSPRLLMPSSHADLRATWHGERGVVLSLWHGDVCAASAPLPISEAARLAGFLVDHVAAWAAAQDEDRSRGRPDDGVDRAAGSQPSDTSGAQAARAQSDRIERGHRAGAAGVGREHGSETREHAETPGPEPGGQDPADGPGSPTAQHPSARPTPIGLAAGARDSGDRRHLRAAPEPGAGQRAGATVDEVVAAGGTAMRTAVTAARRAWRSRRG